MTGHHIALDWGCDAPSPDNPGIPAGLAQGIASGNRFRVILLSEDEWVRLAHEAVCTVNRETVLLSTSVAINTPSSTCQSTRK